MEKKKRLISRNIIIILLVAIFVECCVMSLTFGLLSAKPKDGDMINNFSVGKLEVDIPEELETNEDKEVVWKNDNKKVSLSNTGNVPGIVRATVLPVFKDADGNYTDGTMGSIGAPEGKTLTVGDFVVTFAEDFADSQSANWIYKDGYFYYKKSLEADGTTSNLITGITLADGVDKAKYQDVKVDVEVLADCLQVEGDAPAEWGMQVDDNGNVSAK